mmetsp:Transcript_11085/g.18112  ORF Transcript_11085/g.18112 Transcript_11085/m.18112 type:complete len:187 (-) Transcript_11085:332-892(-)
MSVVVEESDRVEPARVCVITIPLDKQLQHHRDLIQKALRATLVLYLLSTLNALFQVARAIATNPIFVLIPIFQLLVVVLMWWFARSAILWNRECCCGMTNLGTYQIILWVSLIISLADLATNIVLYLEKAVVLTLVGVFVNLLFILVESVNLYYVRQLVVDYTRIRASSPTLDLEGGESIVIESHQ